MNGLRTSRVLVVDDKLEEVMPLLSGLWSRGIGPIVAHITEDGSTGVSSPIGGIRLVFLDLHLLGGTGGTTGVLSSTLSILCDLVGQTCCQAGIVCWTAHPEEASELAQLIQGRAPHLKPPFVGALDKAAFLGVGAGGVERLMEAVQAYLRGNHGYLLSLGWEQRAHDAVTATSAMLAGVAAKSRGKGDQLLALQAALVRAAAGGQCTSAEDATISLLETSSTILLDVIQRQAAGQSSVGEESEALRAECLKETRLAEDQKSALNAALLAAPPAAQGERAQPGDLYVQQGWAPDKAEFPFVLDDKGMESLVRELWPHFGLSVDTQAYSKEVSAFAKNCTPCIVEISPPCDYAARKTPVCRFLGGLVVPAKIDGLGRSTLDPQRVPPASRAYAKQTPCFCIHAEDVGLSGTYSVILNARRLVALPCELTVGRHPVLRFRHAVCADIQAWFASHASRPGFVSV